MKKLLIVFSLVAALVGVMAFNATAAPISGAISISGTYVSDNPDLTLATAFNAFTDVKVSSTGGFGNYDPALSGQPVAFSLFSFAPPTLPIVPLWTFTVSGLTYGFDATGLTVNFVDTNTISMDMTGTAYITGFDATPANVYFSANLAGGTASFSASADVGAPVPEPATLLLLGSGLAGLVPFVRRRFKK